MSLLSGVRFVPKEERKGYSNESSSDTDEDSSLHKKKHRNHKSESKHKKKKKDNDKKRKRKYSDVKKSSKDSNSPEYDNATEIKFMQSLVEAEGLESRAKVSTSDDGFERYNLYDNNNNRGSMINYSKLAFADDPSSDEDNDSGFCDKSEKEIVHDAPRESHRPSEPPAEALLQSRTSAAPHALVSNQSMAAMLRARLQKGEKLVTAPAPGSVSTKYDQVNNDRKYNHDNRSRHIHRDGQDEGNDIDIASFMTVGELKWMSDYKLRDKEGRSTSAGGSVPSLPVSGEKNSSLQELVAMERSGGGVTGNAGDIDKIFADNIIRRGSGYRGNELGLGSGMGAQRGSGGDKAGMDEEEGMGAKSWLGAEADVDSDDNNSDNGAGGKRSKKQKGSGAPSKSLVDKMKKREKELVSGVDMTMFHQKEDKLSEKQIFDRIVKKAMAKKKAYSQTVSNCQRCVVGRRFRQDLVLSTGTHFQLRLKCRNDSLSPGWHCELVPLIHSSSVMLADKEGDVESVVRGGGGAGGGDSGVFKELERFKSCLQRMFERKGQGVVFTETATRSGVSRHHTSIDVVPVPRGAEGEVQMSFKQAFLESGDAFSTHKRRIIPTNSFSKTFHTCLPAHFPYILVEWADIRSVKMQDGKTEEQNTGGQAGLLYILDAAISINDSELDKEDTGVFGTSFCMDVMAGVLEIDQLERKLMRQRAGRQGDTAAVERADVGRFQAEWAMFDWTTYEDCAK